MNATEDQAKAFSIIMLALHPDYARKNADQQKALTDEILNLVINEGIRQVMAEIEIMNAYRPKKTRKTKKAGTAPLDSPYLTLSAKFCPACDFRLDKCADSDKWQCPKCKRLYEVKE